MLNKISQKYPNYEEGLKTAYDNKEENNIIIRSLMTDVTSEMDSVKTGSFFNKRQITFKVFLIIFLSFLLLSFTFISESAAIDDILNRGYASGYHDDDEKVTDEKKPEEREEDDKRDPFGNKTELAAIGEPVPLEIKGYYSESGKGEELDKSGENKGNENFEMITEGEREEYKEDEILKDSILKEAIKEKYNRTE